MRGQIDLSILMVGQFKLAGCLLLVSPIMSSGLARPYNLPLIQTDVVLDKEEHLIRQIRGPEGSRQIDVL